jgi:hypothetical protein
MRRHVLLTHARSSAMISSTTSTEAPRLRCDSRTRSGLPPLSARKRRMSSMVQTGSAKQT